MLAEASYWVTWFPGVVLASAGFLALMWKGIEWFVAAKQTLKQTQAALPLIQAEFSPNGGGSMRDKINVLSEGQVKVFRRLDTQERQLNRHEAVLDRIEDKLHA